MLLGAVSVLVVIASGEPGDGSTRAMEQALRAALGRDASVVVRSSAEDDTALAAAATAEHATILGVVAWSEKQRRVTVRFVKPAEGKWTERELRFDAVDAPTERGRTVGFTLASMLPDDAFPTAEQRAAEVPVPASPPPALATPPSAPPSSEARAPSPPPRSNPLALDLSALAVTAPGGYGGGLGGALAVRVPLVDALGVRGAVHARGGEIGPAQATSRIVVGAAGIAWQPWLDAPRRWALGGRVDALLIYHDIAHLSADDAQAAHLSRVMGGFDAVLEGAYRFSDRAAAIVALGAEVSFGRTDVVVRDRLVASLPPVRAVSELGLRVSF